MKRLAAAALCVVAVAACAEQGPEEGPAPELTPTEVIAAQLAAFKNNGADDAGIARAFRFASPGNRGKTGPLPRFTRMIKRGYPGMLTYERAEFASLRVQGNRAVQLVTLIQPDESKQAYLFQLARITTDACEGCWMVSGVAPVSRDSDRPPVQGGTI